MKSIITAIFTFMLCACASTSNRTTWHPTQTGCFDRGLHETLIMWQDAPLSSASFRIARKPDTGQGPAILVVIDSGKLVNLDNPDNLPIFVAAIGDFKRTCVKQMPLTECPAASAVYDSLRTKSIPLGFDMESPADIRVFHANMYYIDFNDGQGNYNQWHFYGTKHPLQSVINESLDSLQLCWQPTMDTFHGL
jgi:hypothetical protein